MGTVEEWEGSRAWHNWSADASVPNSLRGPCSMGIRMQSQSVITAPEKKIRRKTNENPSPPHHLTMDVDAAQQQLRPTGVLD